MKKNCFQDFAGYPEVLSVLLFLLLFNGRISAQNELDVVTGKWLEYTDVSNSLYMHLSTQAYELLRQREEKVREIQGLEQWQLRQKMIKENLNRLVGPFPEKSALNPKILRTIKKEGYSVEHIIFESQPGFYVTSSLFIPAGLKKGTRWPAVIYCSGHSEDGYRSLVYQHVILNLVKKNFIVFAFDPVGQGERLEYFDPETGKSVAGGPTKEHSYPGAQAFITGSSQARYMIWDGIRAVDYLLTRKEVDPVRIGITGRSGGGTQSAQIAALDERIHAAAPENYITNYTRLIESIGPQDAEQNITNMIGSGLDHPDLLIVRAPKPTLMITTTDDMFSIQGARETEKEVAQIFAAYNKPENFSRCEDNAAHASTLKNRETMYAFFQKHLSNPGNPKDEQTTILVKDEIQVTKTGQISTSFKGETVFSLNKKDADKQQAAINQLRKNPSAFLPEAINSAKKLSGYVRPEVIGQPVYTGRITRGNYVIDRYFLKGEGDYIVPYLLFIPQKSDGRALIWLHPSGKSAEAGRDGEIEKLVNEGITVLAPDLLGTGETGPGSFQGDAYFDGVSHNLWYASILIGRSITGIQCGDVIRLAEVLKINGLNSISALAMNELSPVLLHAAAFSTDIENVVLVEPYTSWYSVAGSHFYNNHFIPGTVAGALGKYDLPDLAGSLAPRKLFIAGITDSQGNHSDPSANDDLEIIRSFYNWKNATDNLKIIKGKTDLAKNINEWLK